MQAPNRSRRGASFVALCLLAIVLNGCTTERPLPAAEFADRCRGVATDAVLAGSANDRRVTWLQTPEGGQMSLVWPAGWTARFSPDLQVLDVGGVVRMRAGDRVSGICFKGSAADPSQVVMIDGLLGN
jgi:hypothetical protein